VNNYPHPISSDASHETPDSSVDEIERLFRVEAPRIERSLVVAFFKPDLAAEAVSEAFAQLIRRGGEVRSPSRWVWSAAFAIARGLGQSDVTLYADPPDEPVLDDEPAFELRSALKTLSPKQREAIVLHHYAGFGLSDIAKVTGSSVGALKVHLARARQRMRVQLMEAKA